MVYKNHSFDKDSINLEKLKSKEFYQGYGGTHVKFSLSIIISEYGDIHFNNEVFKIDELSENLLSFINESKFDGFNLEFWFNKNFTFQEYIKHKSIVSSIKDTAIVISDTEYIY